MRPIRSFPDEVEALAIALRDELRFDEDEVADIAVHIIGSDWFRDLTGISPCDRVKVDCRCPEEGRACSCPDRETEVGW